MINAIKVKTLSYTSPRTLNLDGLREGIPAAYGQQSEWGKSLDWKGHRKDSCLVLPFLQDQRMNF